jgi:hypothetical protein
MAPSHTNGWKREPYPGHVLYHLKWSHGVWVSDKTKAVELEAIHRQLHEPPPEGWVDNGTWFAPHTHEWPKPVQSELPTEESWEW